MKKIVFLFAILLLTGCSGKPSNDEIEEQVVGNLLSDGGEEIFQIENFKKINGFEKDSKTYIADVKYDLVFRKGIKELAKHLKQESKGSPLGAFGAGFGIMALQMQYGNFKAGHRVTKEEKVTFIKTENGWRISEQE